MRKVFGFRKRKLSEGFTLIELMVVIAIIAVLVGAISVSFVVAQVQGRDTRRKADLRAIQQALEVFHQDLGYYPSTPGWADQYNNEKLGDGPGAGDTALCGAKFNFGNTVYLQKIPCDPKTGYTYDYDASNSQGSGNPDQYILTACLESGNDPQGDFKNPQYGSKDSACPASAPDSYTVSNPQ